jgi:ribosomal protein S18 acetylase RimI-like enzyme
VPGQFPIDAPSTPDAVHVKLRRAIPDDAAAVRELTRAAYARWVPLIGREPLPMRADYDAAVRNHLIDLLFAGERLAALIETIPHDDHQLVENVAVLPAFHGRGYGRSLMAHAETLAASLGLKEVRLYTNKDFAANVRLYLGLGYEVDREEPFMNGVTVYMSKKLHSPAIEP